MIPQHLFTPLYTTQETLTRVVSIYFDSWNIRTWLSVSVVILVPLTTLLASLTQYISSTLVGEDEVHKFSWSKVLALFLLFMTRQFISHSINSIGEAVMVRAVAEIYTGRRPTFRACFQAALSRLFTVFVAATLVSAGIVIGFYLCFYVPGIIVLVSSLLVTPAVVLEHKDPIAAIMRSYDLTMYHRWYIFKNLLVVGIAEMLTKYALMRIFHDDDHFYAYFFTVKGQWIRSLPQTIFYPLYTILEVVIYLNLRVQQEGLTAEGLAQELDEDMSSSYRRVPLMSLNEPAGDADATAAPPFATNVFEQPQVLVSDIT